MTIIQPENPDQGIKGPAVIRSFLWVLIALHVAAIVILSWVPPVSRDALTHHLAVPKLYLERGAMVELPDIGFSYYPMNLDLLYIIPLYFGNDILAKYIHFGFALLTAAMLYGYLRRRLGSLYAAVGALFFLSIPVIVKLSITVYVDLGLVFFSLASLLFLLRWAETGFRMREILISGLFCGLALGTKYNGLLLLIVLPPLAVMNYIRSGPSSPGRQLRAVAFGLIFTLTALAVYSPWIIRNLRWTGNPIYPLYNELFSPPTDAPQPKAPGTEVAAAPRFRHSGWNHLTIRRAVYGESWWQIATIPVRIFFQGRDDDPRYFDGKLNPFLFLLPFAAFYRFRRDAGWLRREKGVFLAFVVLFSAMALLNMIRIRYIAPVIPPLVILSMFGLHRVVDGLGRRGSGMGRAAGIIIVVAALMLNAVYLVRQFSVVRPLDYISGKVDRSAYISRHRPEYPAIRYANQYLPGKAKIMGIFMGNRRYYSDRNLVLNDYQLANLVLRMPSPKEAARRLIRRGYTHLLIRHDLFTSTIENDLNAEQKTKMALFFDHHTRLLFTEGGYGLYEIRG